jgi:hypothetical protein
MGWPGMPQFRRLRRTILLTCRRGLFQRISTQFGWSLFAQVLPDRFDRGPCGHDGGDKFFFGHAKLACPVRHFARFMHIDFRAIDFAAMLYLFGHGRLLLLGVS